MTLRSEVDKLAIALQKHVRLKAADSEGYITCITCGARKHWKQSDGAHYISRTHQSTKCIEENIHPSCKRCNMINDVFVQEAYTNYMIDMYGKDFVEELKILAKKPHKSDRIEVHARLKEINKLNKELEANL